MILSTNVAAEILYTDYLTEASFGGPVYACDKVWLTNAIDICYLYWIVLELQQT